MKFYLIIILSIIVNFPFESEGKNIKNFNSGEKKVHILELYTSQSCSSCPPADKWLNQLQHSNLLWNKVIPLEFHVSYWNHLNWKDIHSKDEFNDRQRHYDRLNKTGVYTPQVLLNGVDYRKWRWMGHTYLNKESSPGNLSVKYNKELGKAYVEFKPNSDNKNLICFGAEIKGGLVKDITSGENSGKTLKHEFVVKNLMSNKMITKDNRYVCEINIYDVGANKKRAVAFWVADKSNLKIIQATGGRL